jgi:CBS domain-containing protein
MKVEQIMTRSVHACRATSTLADAASIMLDADCGFVPVVSEDGSERVIGVLTDRDICMATLARGRAPQDVAVGDVMSRDVRTLRTSATLQAAEDVMREARLRRLPVVDTEGRLVGVLSLADLAIEAERKRALSRRPITEEEVGDTLGAICEPGIPSQLVAGA